MIVDLKTEQTRHLYQSIVNKFELHRQDYAWIYDGNEQYEYNQHILYDIVMAVSLLIDDVITWMHDTKFPIEESYDDCSMILENLLTDDENHNWKLVIHDILECLQKPGIVTNQYSIQIIELALSNKMDYLIFEKEYMVIRNKYKDILLHDIVAIRLQIAESIYCLWRSAVFKHIYKVCI